MSPLVPSFTPASAAALPALARRRLALWLLAASRALARAASRTAAPPARRAAARALPQQLEFHAEAGAPEGALYADGELVALLPGVNRL